MDRASTLKSLDRITDMTNEEVAANAEWIREVASKAHMHINALRRNVDNKRKELKKSR